jgi:hypothetical protein
VHDEAAHLTRQGPAALGKPTTPRGEGIVRQW